MNSLIPKVLNDWTEDAITTLLKAGYKESDLFDFKEMLPHKSDKAGKFRLVSACGAFANSFTGGFLIFGVKDDASLAPENRVVGLEPTLDFPEHFGNFASAVEPSVEWEFRNPPIGLGNGRVLHVVYIPPSWRAPHAVKSEQGAFIFPKRTNKGDEQMSYNEVQLMFLGYYEKRLKLKLMMSELEQIQNTGTSLIVPLTQRSTHFGVGSFELNILEGVLTDSYSVLVAYPDLLRDLNSLRSMARNVNGRIDSFRPKEALPMNNKSEIVKAHNDAIAPICEQIVTTAKTAITEITKITTNI